MSAGASVPAVDLDEFAVSLAQQAAALSRLVFNQAELGMTRSESSLLVTLREGPRRRVRVRACLAVSLSVPPTQDRDR